MLMKKVYIDLGAFDGDTIELALKKYPDLDDVYAFEPLAANFAALNRRFGGHDRIHLLNYAADVKNGESVLFLGNSEFGSIAGSQCRDMSSVNDQASEKVKTIDFAEFIRKQFDRSEHITCKVNIEGKEYDLLNHLINTGAIDYLDELYVDWHWSRMKMKSHDHEELVRRLRRLGFKLTGYSLYDEFGRAAKINPISLLLIRYGWYHAHRAKRLITGS
jgi:FkbM family methyltransferase